MVKNSLIILGVTLGLLSCTSLVKQKKYISIQQVEQIPIGVSSEEVLSLLGKPSEKREIDKKIIFIYDNPSGDMQRASLGFDAEKKLEAKMVMPDESEPESSVEFVLKSKFPQGKFLSINFPQCGMDYVSGSALFVDYATGVSIIYHKGQRDVEAISWNTPVRLKQNVEDIKSCKDRGEKRR